MDMQSSVIIWMGHVSVEQEVWKDQNVLSKYLKTFH